MKVIFPFEEGKSSIVERIRRPVAHVEFHHLKQDIWQPLTLIIDSGADYTLLPKFIAEPLGIQLSQHTYPLKTFGIGGGQKVYFLKQKVRIRLSGLQSEIRLGILDSDHVPPLLGRLDFFATFRIVFEGNKTIISPLQSSLLS